MGSVKGEMPTVLRSIYSNFSRTEPQDRLVEVGRFTHQIYTTRHVITKITFLCGQNILVSRILRRELNRLH